MSDRVFARGDHVGHAVLHNQEARHAQGQRWNLRCDCGAKFSSREDALRVAGPEFACQNCSPREAPKTCSLCAATGHNRQNCPRRHGRVAKYPECCAGLAHRRPKLGACECGERYTPLAPVTLEDVMAMPREDRGTV